MNLAWGIVDVRDVAKAHVAAITNPKAQGRYIACSDTLSFLGIVDAVRHKVCGVVWCGGRGGGFVVVACRRLGCLYVWDAHTTPKWITPLTNAPLYTTHTPI